MKSCAVELVTKKHKLIQEYAREKEVLDLGCVAHDLSRESEKHWLHKNILRVANSVLGIDYDKISVESLCNLGYNVEFGDVENFQLDRKFELIVAGDIIEHLNNQGRFLISVKRHMNSNSKLIISTSNATGLIYCIEAILLGYEINNRDHVLYHTYHTLKQLLDRHGLSIKKTYYLTENFSYRYSRRSMKVLSVIKFLFQLFVTKIRPCLAQQIIVVCTIKSSRKVTE